MNRNKLRRIGSLLGLGFSRIRGRIVGSGSNRLLLTVSGVALAVMLMTTVTGVALGLVSQSAVQSDDVDYWIVPQGSTVSSIVAPMGETRLGNAHRTASQLNNDERISHVTPVLLQVIPLTNPESGTQEFVLLVGVVRPSHATPTIAGLPTDPLSPGDPFYANGTYNGPKTGELVLSSAAAQLLESSAGDTIYVRGRTVESEFTVTNVSAGDLSTGIGEAPVGLVHLSELQSLTGATQGDAADQILVSTNSPNVKADLENIYPQTAVVTRTGIGSQEPTLSSLPLAMGVAAFAISLVVGVLFVATMMGLEITGDRRNLAVLEAIGYSGASRALLVVSETVSLAFLGGICGVVLGVGGIELTNILADRYLGIGSIAIFTPALIGYGVGVAVLIGLLASPYPLYLSRRSDLLEVIRG